MSKDPKHLSYCTQLRVGEEREATNSIEHILYRKIRRNPDKKRYKFSVYAAYLFDKSIAISHYKSGNFARKICHIKLDPYVALLSPDFKDITGYSYRHTIPATAFQRLKSLIRDRGFHIRPSRKRNSIGALVRSICYPYGTPPNIHPYISPMLRKMDKLPKKYKNKNILSKILQEKTEGKIYSSSKLPMIKTKIIKKLVRAHKDIEKPIDITALSSVAEEINRLRGTSEQFFMKKFPYSDKSLIGVPIITPVDIGFSYLYDNLDHQEDFYACRHKKVSYGQIFIHNSKGKIFNNHVCPHISQIEKRYVRTSRLR